MKTLNLIDDSFENIFEQRLENEETIEGINATLFFQSKNEITGLYVKPGVSYSRFTERMDFTNRVIEIDTSIITTIVTNPDGEVISETNEEVIDEKETINRSIVHYQLHQFELPIALGYNFNFNQFSLDVEAGIRLNFLQRATGSIFNGLDASTENGEDGFLDLTNSNVDLFKKSVGLGFFAGVLLKRKIGPRTELYVAPRFSFNTLSYSSNANPINQQYRVAGIHTGLIYAIY